MTGNNALQKSDTLAEFLKSLRGADRVSVSTPNALGEWDTHSFHAKDVADALEATQATELSGDILRDAIEESCGTGTYFIGNPYGEDEDGFPIEVIIDGTVDLTDVAKRASTSLTPQSARDWLAAHDKEIVERERERCAKIAEGKVHGWNAAAAIRAGGEQ